MAFLDFAGSARDWSQLRDPGVLPRSGEKGWLRRDGELVSFAP
jgi:hypothetical protein